MNPGESASAEGAALSQIHILDHIQLHDGRAAPGALPENHVACGANTLGDPPALPGRQQKFDRSGSPLGSISSTFIFSVESFC